jgi:tRNA nucleotidyltransferase/poly(A) polymerase
MQIYQVGGSVRDELLGTASKDLDYTVVLDEDEISRMNSAREAFAYVEKVLESDGFEVFQSRPEFFTIRAQFPKGDPRAGSSKKLVTADFVMARREGEYTDGRRPDSVEIGTLQDDLQRRDFTMNAIAKDKKGALIDPFNGVQDINDRVIRAVGSAYDRLSEDALRAVRALRFSVTKGFRIDSELRFAMETYQILDKVASEAVADDRIKDELDKMFRFNTLDSLVALSSYRLLTEAMFSGRVWLLPTLKER